MSPGRLSLECMFRDTACGAAGVADDDPIGVGVEGLAGDEVDAAEGDGDVALPVAGLGGLARVGAEGLAAEVHPGDHGGVADRAVDHHAGPAVGAAELGDEVADERRVHGGVAVDHQDAALAGLAEDALEQRVVLETPDRGDASAELAAPAEVPELGVAAAHLGTDLVDQIGGGDELDGVAAHGWGLSRARAGLAVNASAAHRVGGWGPSEPSRGGHPWNASSS